jgi:hypothetical protein
MDKSIERIIRRVLEEARAGGRDHLTQTELAVRAVREARPDMTAFEALAAVDNWTEHDLRPRHLPHRQRPDPRAFRASQETSLMTAFRGRTGRPGLPLDMSAISQEQP